MRSKQASEEEKGTLQNCSFFKDKNYKMLAFSLNFSSPKLSQSPEVAKHLSSADKLEHHVQVTVVLQWDIVGWREWGIRKIDGFYSFLIGSLWCGSDNLKSYSPISLLLFPNLSNLLLGRERRKK